MLQEDPIAAGLSPSRLSHANPTTAVRNPFAPGTGMSHVGAACHPLLTAAVSRCQSERLTHDAPPTHVTARLQTWLW